MATITSTLNMGVCLETRRAPPPCPLGKSSRHRAGDSNRGTTWNRASWSSLTHEGSLARSGRAALTTTKHKQERRKVQTSANSCSRCLIWRYRGCHLDPRSSSNPHVNTRWDSRLSEFLTGAQNLQLVNFRANFCHAGWNFLNLLWGKFHAASCNCCEEVCELALICLPPDSDRQPPPQSCFRETILLGGKFLSCKELNNPDFLTWLYNFFRVSFGINPNYDL